MSSMAPKKPEEPERKPLIGRVGTNLKMGIVGIPNVGKSTFFNVITKSQAAAENFPFCTIDPNENKYLDYARILYTILILEFKLRIEFKLPLVPLSYFCVIRCVIEDSIEINISIRVSRELGYRRHEAEA